MHSVYADMAAARYSSDVLQMFYGPIPREEKTNLPEPLKPDLNPHYMTGSKYPKTISKNGSVCGEWIYPKGTQTGKIF